MGLTMEVGDVVRWLVAVGEPVRSGQPVVEIETYKATLEVESPIDGTLRAALEPRAEVPAGAVIGIVAAPDEDIDGLALWSPGSSTGVPEAAVPEQPALVTTVTDASSGRVAISPAARQRAMELGIDLRRVQGTGPRGRIRLEDVDREAAAASAGSRASASAAGQARVPLDRMRMAVADLMTQSAAIPQFTLEATANVRVLSEARQGAQTLGISLSFSDALLAVCARALRSHPTVNASFDGDALVLHDDINLGIAVAVETGLIVPVMRGADQLSLAELRGERERLTAAAEAQKLAAADLTGATFTVSNLGPLGIERFRALVVPPQAAILAVGALTGDATIALSLSCDHRVLDGAAGARFLVELVGLLEDPSWLGTLV
jgi:pyruvate dehydrogenase E2 component (dihydrolipoamide acetyltransferase)